MNRLNLANWIECTEVEGPGKRFALWVQGCNRHCPGCCNPHMLDFVPNRLVGTDGVCQWIDDSLKNNDIEGVTFLGGEPMLQAKGLSEVASWCSKRGLSIMTFTGYTLRELETAPLPSTSELLQFTDLLVDGPFIQEQPEIERNWAGSTNQRFHFLTDRYKKGIEYDPRFSHGFELRIKPDGSISSNGWPIAETLPYKTGPIK